MSELERRVWWLLRAYPRSWRDARGDDLVATVLEMSRPGQRWPSLRFAADLLVSGWVERAREHRRSSGSWFAAGRRIALVVAVMVQVVVAGVWLRQWFADGLVPMLSVLGAASAYTFVGALSAFIVATAAWLCRLGRLARVLARVAFALWFVTVFVFQLGLSGDTSGAVALMGWTYLAVLATWGLHQPRPTAPRAMGSATAAAGVIAVAMTPSVLAPTIAGWLLQAPWGVEPSWVAPVWIAGSIVAIAVARKDPRWVIATSLLLPLVGLLYPWALGTVEAGLGALATAVLLAAFLAPRAASSP